MPASSDLEISELGETVTVRVLQAKVFNDQRMEDIIHELRYLTSKLGQRELRVDLGLVKYLQSSALGKLVTLHARAKATGGHLILCNVHPTVATVLSSTRLDKLLTVQLAPPDEANPSEE